MANGSHRCHGGPIGDAVTVPRRGRRVALAMVVLAAASLAIAAYLAYTKLTGGLPACGLIEGCETVATSSYATFLGIPVAVYGVAGSAILLGASAAWWWRADRRALLVVYGFGLASVLVVAFLTFLEVAVIHAVCVWCVAYAVTIVAGWLLSVVELRRTPA